LAREETEERMNLRGKGRNWLLENMDSGVSVSFLNYM
jgi:hypothetical protein